MASGYLIGEHSSNLTTNTSRDISKKSVRKENSGSKEGKAKEQKSKSNTQDTNNEIEELSQPY